MRPRAREDADRIVHGLKRCLRTMNHPVLQALAGAHRVEPQTVQIGPCVVRQNQHQEYSVTDAQQDQVWAQGLWSLHSALSVVEHVILGLTDRIDHIVDCDLEYGRCLTHWEMVKRNGHSDKHHAARQRVRHAHDRIRSLRVIDLTQKD